MQSTEIHPGDIVAGKYRVRAILGRKHGLLVDAFHTEFDQRVVIKVLLPGAGDSKEIERFRREARTLAKLSSEHAARIVDVGSEPDGSFYLVREYLEGTDLASYLRANGRLSLPDAVLLILQAAEAAAETHSHGIIVREIQPSTLFLTQRPGGAPLLKIIDFGTAKLMNAAAAPGAGAELTATAMFGLSQYSSPEMIRKAKSADGRTDVWSLGCILYEMLTGRAPFTGEAAMLMLQITREEPTPPSHVVPQLPPEIDQVIGWAIAKDVDARFKNMYAFAHALKPFAPPEGQILVDRIGQILEAGKRRPKPASLPPPAAPPRGVPAAAAPPPRRGEESFTREYVPPAAVPPPRGSSPATVPPPRGSSPAAVSVPDDSATARMGTGDFAAQPAAPNVRTVPPPALPSQPAAPDQASSPPGGYASASVPPPGRGSSPGYSQAELQGSGALPAYTAAAPPQKGLLDKRVVVGALAAVAVLLPAMVAILVMSRNKTADAPPAPTAAVTVPVPAAPPSTAAVAPTPSVVAPPPAPTSEPPAAPTTSAPATTQEPVAAADPTTKKGSTGSGGGTKVAVKEPPPKPEPTTKPDPPAGGGGGNGTLMAVALGGTCAFSVNGSSKGSGSSIRVSLPPGTYSVMCKASGGGIKSKSISVKSGETAMATFKL